MTVTVEELESYSTTLDALADRAEEEVTFRLATRWREVRGKDLRESVPMMREEAAAALVGVETTWGSSAAAVGSDMLRRTLDDGTEVAAGLDALEIADAYADAQSARYWAGLIDGTDEGFERFLSGVSSRARRNVSHAADREVAMACAKMGRSSKGIRFARVPSGPSCGFCIMLASRGFVYATRESAGALTKFHDNCDCRIVAGMEGIEVEGYDPKGMRDRFDRCRATLGGDGRVWADWCALTPEERARYGDRPRLPFLSDPQEQRAFDERYGANADGFNDYYARRICAEMDTRDPHWSITGEPATVDYSDKPKESLHDHELAAIRFLSEKHGIPLKTILEDDNAPANLDLEIDGQGWELKSPKSGKHAVDDRLTDAFHKFRKLNDTNPRIIICNSESTRSDEEVLNECLRRIQHRKKTDALRRINFLFLSKDGENLLRYTL